MGAMRHPERHRTHRVGWLRAAVLGANDGIVSTASLVLGVAAAGADAQAILVAGVAGLVAGAMSMAAGEYVSVSSQSDTEDAEIARERKELETQPEFERQELAGIYQSRGLTPELALQVADQLMAHDALGAHARDELGITEVMRARPLQAAAASAAAFAVGALPVVAIVWLAPVVLIATLVIAATVALLAVLGSTAAVLGGAPVWRAALRVTFWGLVAMLATALVGRLFGAAV